MTRRVADGAFPTERRTTVTTRANGRSQVHIGSSARPDLLPGIGNDKDSTALGAKRIRQAHGM